MNKNDLTALTFAEAIAFAVLVCRSGNVPMLWGPPGIGKTNGIAKAVAEALELKLVVLEPGYGDEAEIVGVSVLMPDGTMHRVPVAEAVKLWAGEACLLFLDEVNRGGQHRQSPLLSALQDGRLGDTKAHPDSMMMAAGNFPESGGADPLISAATNRMVHGYVQPTATEVLTYLSNVGAAGSPVNVAASGYAAMALRRPALLQLTPPEGVEADGNQWASPRMVEKFVFGLAEFETSKDVPAPVLAALATGCLGPVVGQAWLSIRAMQGKVSSPEEIANGKGVVPDDSDLEIALLGVLPAAFTLNRDETWAFVAKLGPEVRMVVKTTSAKYFPTTVKGRAAWQKAISGT